MTQGPFSGQEEGRGHLLRNMVLFARLLRVGDLDVTPNQLANWLEALDRIDIRRKDDFKCASRAILVSRFEDREWFDLAFELFWQARDPRQLSELELGLLIQRQTEKKKRGVMDSPGAARPQESDDGPKDDDKEPEQSATWSARELLRHKDFAELTGEELDEIRRLIATMRLRVDLRRSRRPVSARSGERLDIRRSLRRSLSRGGELVELAKRSRKRRRRPVVLLCDVSGSMEPYSRLLLRFIYAISHRRSAAAGLSRVETFVFGTRLTRITPQLRSRNVDYALASAAREIEDWGGGTRTGESLKEFNYLWSRRVLGQGAVVMLISDGWDRGDIDLLGIEMKRLSLSCHRLIWLNPLLGSLRYEPLTRGMVAALPFVDHFLPVHNLVSLERLGELLGQLDERRGGRRRSA